MFNPNTTTSNNTINALVRAVAVSSREVRYVADRRGATADHLYAAAERCTGFRALILLREASARAVRA
jgi:hypothetical protein